MLLLPGKKQRDRALGKLWRSGLGVTKLFVRTLPRYAFLSSCFRDGAAPCPNAEDLADRMLTVTNSPWLDDENFARIIAALGESL